MALNNEKSQTSCVSMVMTTKHFTKTRIIEFEFRRHIPSLLTKIHENSEVPNPKNPKFLNIRSIFEINPRP